MVQIDVLDLCAGWGSVPVPLSVPQARAVLFRARAEPESRFGTDLARIFMNNRNLSQKYVLHLRFSQSAEATSLKTES